jgi:phosphomannomutase
VKVILPDGWFLVRGSNTEPIIRVIAEARNKTAAQKIFAGIYKQVAACIDT